MKEKSCVKCGCTFSNPCYTHNEGYCWWIEDSIYPICSHCYYGFHEKSLEESFKERKENV